VCPLRDRLSDCEPDAVSCSPDCELTDGLTARCARDVAATSERVPSMVPDSEDQNPRPNDRPASKAPPRRVTFEKKNIKSNAVRKRTLDTTVQTSRKEDILVHIQDTFSDAAHPQDIYKTLSEKNIELGSRVNQETIITLMKLFFTAGSPQAFAQLIDSYKLSRLSGTRPLTMLPSMLEITRNLDILHITGHSYSIMRRYLPTSLARKHQAMTKQGPAIIEEHRRQRSTLDTSVRIQRADTIILAQIMKEVYPSLQETRTKVSSQYNSNLGLLRQRIGSGRNWLRLTDRFGMGILALIPTDEHHAVANKE
jgi:hypothetical protein